MIMIKWCHKAVFYLRPLSTAKIYGVSEYGAPVPCDWTALYNAALLRRSAGAPLSPPPQYCSRQDSGPGWEPSHQERLFLEKASREWKRTTLFLVVTIQNYLKLGVLSATSGRRFASQRPYGQQLTTAGYWGPH
jgi:hypothetical protein